MYIYCVPHFYLHTTEPSMLKEMSDVHVRREQVSKTKDNSNAPAACVRRPIRIRRRPSAQQIQTVSRNETKTSKSVTDSSAAKLTNVKSSTTIALGLHDSNDYSSRRTVDVSQDTSLPQNNKNTFCTESMSEESLLGNENVFGHDESLLAEMASLEQELTEDQSQTGSTSLLDNRDDDDLMLEMEEFIS